MCEAGQFGNMWTRMVFTGEKSLEEAAKMFQMEPTDVMEHVNDHEIRKVTTDTGEEEYESDDFYLSKLLQTMKYLMAWVEFVGKGEDVNKSAVDMLTKLTKESRETVKTIAEFQGRRDTVTTKIQIDSMETKVLNLTNVLLQEACPTCKAKMMEVLQSQ